MAKKKELKKQKEQAKHLKELKSLINANHIEKIYTDIDKYETKVIQLSLLYFARHYRNTVKYPSESTISPPQEILSILANKLKNKGTTEPFKNILELALAESVRHHRYQPTKAIVCYYDKNIGISTEFLEEYLILSLEHGDEQPDEYIARLFIDKLKKLLVTLGKTDNYTMQRFLGHFGTALKNKKPYAIQAFIDTKVKNKDIVNKDNWHNALDRLESELSKLQKEKKQSSREKLKIKWVQLSIARIVVHMHNKCWLEKSDKVKVSLSMLKNLKDNEIHVKDNNEDQEDSIVLIKSIYTKLNKKLEEIEKNNLGRFQILRQDIAEHAESIKRILLEGFNESRKQNQQILIKSEAGQKEIQTTLKELFGNNILNQNNKSIESYCNGEISFKNDNIQSLLIRLDENQKKIFENSVKSLKVATETKNLLENHQILLEEVQKDVCDIKATQLQQFEILSELISKAAISKESSRDGYEFNSNSELFHHILSTTLLRTFAKALAIASGRTKASGRADEWIASANDITNNIPIPIAQSVASTIFGLGNLGTLIYNLIKRRFYKPVKRLNDAFINTTEIFEDVSSSITFKYKAALNAKIWSNNEINLEQDMFNPGEEKNSLFSAISVQYNSEEELIEKIVNTLKNRIKDDIAYYDVRVNNTDEEIENFIEGIKSNKTNWTSTISPDKLMRFLDSPILILDENMHITNKKEILKIYDGDPIFAQFNAKNNHYKILTWKDPKQNFINACQYRLNKKIVIKLARSAAKMIVNYISVARLDKVFNDNSKKFEPEEVLDKFIQGITIGHKKKLSKFKKIGKIRGITQEDNNTKKAITVQGFFRHGGVIQPKLPITLSSEDFAINNKRVIFDFFKITKNYKEKYFPRYEDSSNYHEKHNEAIDENKNFHKSLKLIPDQKTFYEKDFYDSLHKYIYRG